MKSSIFVILIAIIIGGSLGFLKKRENTHSYFHSKCAQEFDRRCEVFYIIQGHQDSDRGNFEEAKKDYLVAAKNKSGQAYFHLGWMCHYSADNILRYVIKPQKPKNMQEITKNSELSEFIKCAEDNYRMSADLGFAPAMINYEWLRETWGSSYNIFTYKSYFQTAVAKQNPIAMLMDWYQKNAQKGPLENNPNAVLIGDVFYVSLDLSKSDEDQYAQLVLSRTIYRDKFISRTYTEDVKRRIKENPSSVLMATYDKSQRYVSGHLIVGIFNNFNSHAKKIKN